MTTKELMAKLAQELKRTPKNQKVIDKLNRELDRVLGTELTPNDADRAEVWEKNRR